MKAFTLLFVAAFLSGCADPADSPQVSLMEELRSIKVDISRPDKSTLHGIVESIERQANKQLSDSRRIAIVVELPRIDPPPRQEDAIPSLGGPIRNVSLPDAIRYLAEVAGVQHHFIDDERKIVMFLKGCTQSSDSAAIRSQQLASEATQAFIDEQYLEAQSLLAEAARIHPEFAEAWVGHGAASALLGDVAAAKQSYERALQLHAQRYRESSGNNTSQLLQQVYLLFLLGRDTEARDLLAQGLRTHPDDPQLTMFSEGTDDILSDQSFLKQRAIQP